MSSTEIEVKVKVDGVDALLSFLEKNGSYTGEKYQKDSYFIPSHRDFLATRPVEEWLRLRQSKKSVITYKKWHYDENGKSIHCDEYETELGDTDSLRKIFEALNFTSSIVVEKTRKTWDIGDYEVSVDLVTDIGDFVEVEYKGSDPDAKPDKIADEMIVFLKQAGCSNIRQSYQGYPFMALYPDEVEFVEV